MREKNNQKSLSKDDILQKESSYEAFIDCLLELVTAEFGYKSVDKDKLEE